MIVSIVVQVTVLAGLIGIIVGVVRLVRQSPEPRVEGGRRAGLPLDPERIFLHVMSFAGLVAVLYAVTGLASLLLIEGTLRAGTLVSASDARTRASYYLAALVVGLPIWLACWTVAQRRAGRSGEERLSQERRWFLAAVFATTAVVALFGLHSLLRALLSLPGASESQPTLADAIYGGARLVVWGAAWFLYARLGWRDRSGHEEDEAHDLAVYAVAAWSLTFLSIGLYQALNKLIGDLLAPAGSTLLSPSPSATWSTWGPMAAWVLSGGMTWASIWRYDLLRSGKHRLRILYLYLVLAVAVPVALAAGIDTVYEVVRRAFGYRPDAATWLFLRDSLPPLLLGGAAWAYHWSVLRQQASPEEARRPIPWPRRPALAVLVLLGLSVAAVAFVSLLWLELDFLLKTGTYLLGGDWWRDRLSAAIAAGVLGGALWLKSWSTLQRAAATDPAGERTAPARRRLLGLIVLAGSLISIGFAIDLLWLLFRGLLGGTLDAGDASRTLKSLSTVVVALAVAVYHGRILQSERPLRRTRAEPVRLTALVAPGAEELLQELVRLRGRPADTVVHLLPDGLQSAPDAAGMHEHLTELEGRQNVRGVILVLQPSGGSLYPYDGRAAHQPGLHPGEVHGDPVAFDSNLDPSPKPLP